MKKIHSVEAYIELNSHCAEALTRLCTIINATELEETVKWSMPTYCLNGKNVLSIGPFKNHFCLWFHQGVFLKDKQHLLINAQENKTKALRQMRFETKADIIEAKRDVTKHKRLDKITPMIIKGVGLHDKYKSC